MPILRVMQSRQLGRAIAPFVGLTVLVGIGIGVANGAIAQQTQPNCVVRPRQTSRLTCANLYRVIQEVQLTPFGARARTVPSGGRAVLQPQDRLRTLWGSRAELQFNEGSLVWSNPNTVFDFRPGLRLISLRTGAALVVTEPGAPPINVRTAEASVRPRGTAYVVQRNDVTELTEVFALTDNSDGPLVVVSPDDGQPPVELNAGQLVRATPEGFSPVEEFDLQTFYLNNSLVAGLGPNQEATVAQKPPTVQATLNAARVETLAAVRAQNRGFRQTFLPSALVGADSDFRADIERVDLREEIDDRPPGPFDGTFIRQTENDNNIDDGDFEIDVTGQVVPITLDFDERRVTIGGVEGRASRYGLAGDRAFGTIIVEDGGVIRDIDGNAIIPLEAGDAVQVEAFEVDGSEPQVGEAFRGRLIRGTVPDY